MNFKLTGFCLTLMLSLLGQVSFGQANSCEEVGKDLTKLYNKILPFYYGDSDSLIYYSDLFSSKLTNYIKNNPSSIDCKFKPLTDSKTISIVTSADNSFRIYSWDTWLGGTMQNYKNLFQFKSDGKVHTLTFDYGEGDMGTYFTDIFSLKANGKIYFLGVSGGSESSKYAYEVIRAYSINDSTIDDSVKLIKTASGLHNSIFIEYDFFSVADRPERPLKLIKYDADKKIIYIPIVWEHGKVTNKFIRYQFTGQYFEKFSQ